MFLWLDICLCTFVSLLLASICFYRCAIFTQGTWSVFFAALFVTQLKKLESCNSVKFNERGGEMSDNPKIIIVDDDDAVRNMLDDYFTANGIDVDLAENGEVFRERIQQENYDLAILDLRMPGEDGLSLCKYIREEHQMGIVMLTGASDSIDRVVGLEIGADDYIGKPFELREVLARVRAVLRRTQGQVDAHGRNKKANKDETVQTDDVFTFGPVTIDGNRLLLTDKDENVSPLTKMEFDLIKTFAERPSRVLTRDFLLEAAHGRDWEPFDRSIDVRVTRLRKKIEDNPSIPKYLKTVRGIGYRYDPEG